MAKGTTSAQRRIYQAAMRLFAEKGLSQVSVSELAEYADVARGTIYNNIDSLENLFEEVTGNLVSDMNQKVVDSLGKLNDPALRVAVGIRLYVKRAHDEPVWGQFITTFAFSHSALRELWTGHPSQDLVFGIQQGRYQLTMEQVPSAVAQIGSSVISAVYLVREGMKTWRDAGSMAAELTLRAFGLSVEEAQQLAYCDISGI